MMLNRVTYVALVEHDIFDFDVILGMDWLHACFASIDCKTRVVNFNFPNEPIFEWCTNSIFSLFPNILGSDS